MDIFDYFVLKMFVRWGCERIRQARGAEIKIPGRWSKVRGTAAVVTVNVFQAKLREVLYTNEVD